jgi:uncharacterized protein (DUF2147 family)
MRLLMITFLCLLISTLAFSQNNIEGTWQPEGKQAIFKIFEKDGKYYGQLIGSTNQDEDKKIKSKEKIILLRNLEKESDKEYCCGVFIAPENKTKLSASLTLVDKNKIKLTLKKGWFGKTIIWNRI